MLTYFLIKTILVFQIQTKSFINFVEGYLHVTCYKQQSPKWCGFPGKKRNKRSTYYLLIYHDSITVFLLPYISSDLLDEVLILPSHLQNVQRYPSSFFTLSQRRFKSCRKIFCNVLCFKSTFEYTHTKTQKLW